MIRAATPGLGDTLLQTRRGRLLAGIVVLLVLSSVSFGRPAIAAVTSAPALVSPAEGATLTSFQATLSWTNPAATTQVQVQVNPFRNDGPALDMRLGTPATTFQLPSPAQWDGLLPDMTYTWRVRASDAVTSVDGSDASWGPWAERTFRTPKASGATITPVMPIDGSLISTFTPVLQWADSQPDISYYEYQVSKDAFFRASAVVFGGIRNGRTSNPRNSFTVPSGAPLENATTYYWRVRPRVQGDGTPARWSRAWRFTPRFRANVPLPVGSIAFTSSRDTSGQIYLIDQAGAEHRLTNDGSDNFLPVWSPDGTKLAYTSLWNAQGNQPDGQVWVMNADGTGKRQVSTGTGLNVLPVWSPDGAKIAFTSVRIGGSALSPSPQITADIYTVNADGSAQRRVTNGPDLGILPVWAPDSSKIAYMALRNIQSNQPTSEIRVMDADGNYNHQITFASGLYLWPAWGRDSATLAYMSAENLNSSRPDVHIYLADAAGTYQKKLTSDPGFHLLPVWSPDGRQLAFTALTVDTTAPPADAVTGAIFTINADGGSLQRLTTGRDVSVLPAWSPDGGKLAYMSIPTTTSSSPAVDIATINRDGSGAVRVTNGTGVNLLPFWSPDGSRVAYNALIDPYTSSVPRTDIFMASPGGSGQVNLTSAPGINFADSWSPNAAPGAAGLAALLLLPASTGSFSAIDVPAGMRHWWQAVPAKVLPERWSRVWTNFVNGFAARH